MSEDLQSDNRKDVCENCFIELDIALKGYQITFGEDLTFDEMSMLHTTLAYMLSNHKNHHQLANIDIDKFEIHESPFETEEGEPTDKLYHLKTEDSLHYIMNLILNCKSAWIELVNSRYLDGLNNDLMLDKQSLLIQFNMQLDRCILLMNNKYSKLILNIK